MKIEWDNLAVRFYSKGVLCDSESLGSYPVEADTLNSTSTAAQATCTIVPPVYPGCAYDEAIVTGSIRMICTDPWVMPDVNDLFAQVFAF
jgi:hypothetical protein